MKMVLIKELLTDQSIKWIDHPLYSRELALIFLYQKPKSIGKNCTSYNQLLVDM